MICVQCGINFSPNRGNQKFCSRECSGKNHKIRTGRYGLDKNLSSGTVGAISELIISIDLMKREYEVFRALSPACSCDLLGLKNNKIYKFEVRTGYKGLNGKIGYPKSNFKAEYFAIAVRSDNSIYYFPSIP